MTLTYLQSTLSTLDRGTLTQKRSAATDIADTLSSDKAVINKLNTNHLQNTPITWDNVLRIAQKYVISEADRFNENERLGKSQSQTTIDRVITNCNILMTRIIERSKTADFFYLSRNSTLECIFQILGNPVYHKYYLKTYLYILTRLLLDVQHFVYFLREKDWRDITDLLKQICLQDDHESSIRLEIIRALINVFEYAPTFLLRSWSSFIFRQWEIARDCPQLKKSHDLLNMTQTYCEKMASDSRQALCKLGEQIIMQTLSFYDNRIEDYGGKKTILFDFLLLQVTIHHPNGASEDSDLAYANDWTEWKGYLNHIYNRIFQETDVIILKNSRFMNPQKCESIVWENFRRLAVEVLIQKEYYLQQSKLNDDAETSLIKRVRHCNAIEIIFDEIKPGSSTPWLSILQLYILRHPNKITLSSYTFILSRLLSIEFTNKMERHLQFQCYLALLEIEHHIEHGVNKLELNNYWINIWENTIRSFGHNENEDVCVILTNKLLKSKTVDVSSLLRVLNSKKLTINHIQILNILYQSKPLSTNRNDLNYRYMLWEFILNTLTDDAYDTKTKRTIYRSNITANILSGLNLKQFPLIEMSNNKRKNDDYLDNLENLFKKSIFFIDNSSQAENLLVENKITYRIDEQFKTDSMRYIMKFVQTSEEILVKPMNVLENIKIIIDMLIFSLNLTSSFLQFNIIHDTLNFPLINGMRKLIITLSENVNFFMKDESQTITVKDKIEMVENLEMLFDLKLHSKFYNDYSNLDVKLFPVFQQLIYLIEQDDNSNSKTSGMDIMNSNKGLLYKFNNSDQVLSIDEKLLLTSFKVLCSYIYKPHFNNHTQVQTKLIKLTLETFLTDLNFKNVIHLKMGLNFCSAVANSSIPVQSDVLINVFSILDSILKANEHYLVIVLEIFEIFTGILKHSANSDCNEIRRIALKFLDSLYVTEKHGQKILKKILLTTKDVIMLNSQFNWRTGEEQFTSWNKITSCLHCDYHDIRLLAVDVIYDIYSLSKMSIDLKKSFFPQIARDIKKVLKASDSLTDEYNMRDEKNFRVCTVLYGYILIACSDSRIIPECLFSILCFSLKIDTATAQNAIKYMLHKKKEKNLKEFLSSHLDYLITEWCDTKHSIDKIPFQILGYNTEIEFLSKNLYLIVPLSLKKNSHDLLKIICQKIHKDLQTVIEDLFPELYVQILPLLACSETDLTYINNSVITEMGHLKASLYVFLSENCRSELINTKMQDILLNLIKKLDDRKYFEDNFDILIDNTILKNNRLRFRYNTVIECINYLETKYNKTGSFISFFAINSYSFFQKFLLKLSKPIYKSSYQHEQLLALQHYIYFCKWVESYFNTSELEPMIRFLLRDIIYNIVNIVTNANNCDQLRIATCKYLTSFCDTCIGIRQDVFREFCHIIINSIVPLTKNNVSVNLHDTLFKLLTLLIVDNKETITESIPELEPFPNEQNDNYRMFNEIYDKVKYTNNKHNLEIEIQMFLRIQNFENTSRLESLKRLHKLLEQNKDELFQIYNQLKTQQGSFEMCRKSILHNLIISLVELSNSSDEEVKLMAAKCLGELGPSNLRTLILKVDSTKLVDSLNIDISLIVAGVIIQLLSNYIVDKDWEIRNMASEALYATLSSPEGMRIIHETPEGFDEIIGSINLHHIAPFISLNTNYENSDDSFLFSVSDESFNKLNDTDLWCPLYNTLVGHESWLKSLLCTILKVTVCPNYLKIIIPLCEKKINFAEKLLPIIVEMMLCKISDNTQIEIINNKTSLFFKNIYNHYRVHRETLKVMLDVVNLNKLRSNRNHLIDKKHFLNVNYLHIAKGAFDCSAYFTAVFYAELWCRNMIEEKKPETNEDRRLNTIEYVCKLYPNEGEVMQKILRQSYTNIDDPDAVHGCGVSHLLNMEDRVQYYSKMGSWDQAVLYNDFMLSITNIPSQSQSIENAYRLSLKHAGLYKTANIYTKTIDYECLWRMQDWSFNKTGKEIDHNDSFEKYHYLALKSVYDQESNYNFLTITRKTILKSLQNSLETTKNLYSALSKLQLLQEIEDFSKDYTFTNLDEIVKKWQKQSQMDSKDFSFLEPIYNQRITLLEIALNKTQNENVKDVLINFQISLAEMARKQKWFQVGRMALLKLKQFNDIRTVQSYKIQLEEAQLEWDLGLDKKIGRSLLQKLLLTDFDSDKLLRSKAYRLYGTWMMETKSENPNVYFEEALKTLDRFNLRGVEENENRYSSYAALATFTDNEYQQVTKYLNSKAYEIKESCISNAKELCDNFNRRYKDPKNASTDERRMYITNEKNYKRDVEDLENTKQMLNSNLLTAAKYYILCLIECENYNLSIFRLISLWLENRNHEELNDLIQEKLPSIPNYKLLSVLPQIAPHITNSPTDRFAEQINEIIEQCAIDHPHHVLPVILALANATKDNDYIPGKKSPELHPRILQAQIIKQKLSKHPKIKNIVTSMDAISEALIKLAYLEIDKRSTKIPASQPVLKLKNLDHVHIHTLDLPIKPSGNYDKIIGIHKWENTYSTPGGINKPKKIICIGSDGISRNQMVKGQDDLRQDAVMQQVFSILNTLLVTNDLRHLTIRTYKVVPLSRKSGILQWCDNTTPLTSYLVGPGNGGAHARYHPNDYPYMHCHQLLKATASNDNETKLQVFNKICANFQPALHYFFFEKFGSTAAFWWERRRAYTLSVAASSMIGYILGLGDRHLNNILIDTSTAEVIHIDFGIAFEQGHVLPTPETVPFRLSRDIEDGMGISGIEGVFRRSCEKTMSVLRQNSETIITILQVLLYDPLYMWNISVSRAMKVQQRGRQNINSTTQVIEDNEVNKMAERALLRLTQKLQGIENGRVTSVEGQVEQLIQEARNPANLCRLYVGWSSFA